MESLPLAALDRAIQENEGALRSSFGDEGLPESWAEDLAGLPRESPHQKLLYYARVKHYYWVRFQEREEAQQRPGNQTTERALDAARALLRREPVRVRIAGRDVAVTGRSYNALAHIAAHHLRMQELAAAIEHVEELHALEVIRFRGPLKRRRARRRLAFLGRVHRTFFAELLAHRRALYAHAFTPDGAEAEDVDSGHPAPWWRETSIADDATLFVALWEAGPGRWMELGRATHDGDDERGATFVEDFGFHSLLVWLEGKRHMDPAALYNRDVGPWLTSLRAGTLRFADDAGPGED